MLGGYQPLVSWITLNVSWLASSEKHMQISSLSESGSIVRECVSMNGLIVRKLILMLDRNGHKALLHYSVFSSQLATSVLFYCTFNGQALKFLIQKGVHYKMMRVTQRLLEDANGDLALRYYSVLFLARVRTSPEELEDDGAAQTIDRIIERFLRMHKPREVAEWEEEHSYVWMTLVPFIQLAYAGGKYCKCDDSIATGTRPVDANNSTEPKSSCNCGNTCKNFKSAKKTDTIMHSWYCEAALYEGMEDSSFYLTQTNNNASCRCLEKLEVIGNCPSRWPGSRATQRLGLFSLECVLSVKENWSLLVTEGLLPFLVTLNWHLRNSEQALLQRALSKFKKRTWSPPSLQVITKSVFAKRDGFD